MELLMCCSFRLWENVVLVVGERREHLVCRWNYESSSFLIGRQWRLTRRWSEWMPIGCCCMFAIGRWRCVIVCLFVCRCIDLLFFSWYDEGASWMETSRKRSGVTGKQTTELVCQNDVEQTTKSNCHIFVIFGASVRFQSMDKWKRCQFVLGRLGEEEDLSKSLVVKQVEERIAEVFVLLFRSLYRDGLLPKDTRFIGYARSQLTVQQILANAAKYLKVKRQLPQRVRWWYLSVV